MTFTMPDEIVTLQQVQLLKHDVERLIDLVKESARRQKPEPVEVPLLIRKMLGNAEVTVEKLQALQSWLAGAAAFPVVHVILPALPATALRQKLAGWFRGNVGPDLLLAFEYNSGLAGGFALRAGGTVFDFSFRRRILEGAPKFKKVMENVS